MSPSPSWRQNRYVRAAATLSVLCLVGVGVYDLFYVSGKTCVLTAQVKGVLGSTASIMAVAPPGQEAVAQQAIEEAMRELARVDALMGADNSGSELAAFNAAPAGKMVKLSPTTLEVLRLARDFAGKTDGAFDVTCRPMLLLWRDAQKQDRLPTDAQIAQARAKVGWDKVELLPDGARKKIDGVQIELAGVSRGYAIDAAVEAMRRQGAMGGAVNIGYDHRVFGSHGHSDFWPVAVRDAFGGDRIVATLLVREQAVCTRSNYQNSWLHAGKRLGRISDPRTGRPAELVPLVTTVSPKAVDGVWATALSVTGPDGLAKLPPSGPQAMIVTGDKAKWRVQCTADFSRLLKSPMAVASASSGPADGAGR